MCLKYHILESYHGLPSKTKSTPEGKVTESQTISTPLGEVTGSLRTTEAGTQFLSVQGLPFAQPPVGNLR